MENLVFIKKNVISEVIDEIPLYFIDEDYIAQENKKNQISNITFDYSDLVKIGKKFISSQFTDNLSIILIITNDDFSEPLINALYIDFSLNNKSFDIFECNLMTNNDLINKYKFISKNNLEILRVRANSFAKIISTGSPLEDLSIGFQVRMYRFPNVYNFKFWNHFTNIEFIKV